MNNHLSGSPDTNPYKTKELNEIESFIQKQADHIRNLNRIGAALSAEHNLEKLLEMILSQARLYTNADGGTLYLITDDEKHLEFTVVENDSLDIKMGGTKGDITWYPLNLYNENGSKNDEMVAVLCALNGEPINIDDVYFAEGFNFEGTKKFDKGTGFRSKSMLVIPMKNHDNEVMGVCQLLNRMDPATKEVIPFNTEDEKSTLSLASQAAVAISNAKLINDLRVLLESFIESITSVIDAKSPYTGGHVQKVAQLTMIIANALNEADDGYFKDLTYDFDQMNELRIAALMHDVGKVATPEYIVDKSTKLETIFDRIELIKTRFEVIKRDLKIDFINKRATCTAAGKTREIRELEDDYNQKLLELENDLEFLETSNHGGEFMSDKKIERIKKIAAGKWINNGVEQALLTREEVQNLTIIRGTLTEKERQRINDHAAMSIEMLGKLPFPKKLRRIPEIAGGHHEKLNGKGYPLKLSEDQLSLESRVLALADIFEALTASDRPYKEAKKLSEVKQIIDLMVKDNELDKNLVKFFFEKELDKLYCEQALKPEQLD